MHNWQFWKITLVINPKLDFDFDPANNNILKQLIPGKKWNQCGMRYWLYKWAFQIEIKHNLAFEQDFQLKHKHCK